MDKRLYLVLLLVVGAIAVEREDAAGAVADETADREDNPTEDVPQGPQDATCSPLICRVKCRLNNCFTSQCLDNGRCRCYCAKQVDPVETFFRSILTSHMEPGIRLRFTPSMFPRVPQEDDDTEPRRGIFGNNPLLFHSKIYSTLSQTCSSAEDCGRACNNCNATNCVDNFCQCTICTRPATDLRSRATNVVQTCHGARQCAAHCEGCDMVTCRYGACECGRCRNPEAKPEEGVTTTEAATPPAITTTEAVTEPTTVESATETVTIRDNSTSIEVGYNGNCTAKRCNHSCWERQCSKWECVNDKCECDGCPKELEAVVRSIDGKNEKPDDKDRYEVIF